MLVPLPPVPKQKGICDHLDVTFGEMKRIVFTIQSQIEALTAYRKSLIHEWVTEQLRITEADVRRLKAYINIDVA
jgi:hypothetical protein